MLISFSLKNLQVHTFKNACVAAYPSTVQNDILWFWPNTDPQFKDIIATKRPPFIPVLDDPSYSRSMATRDIPCGYDFMTRTYDISCFVELLHICIRLTTFFELSKKMEAPLM